MDQTEDYRWVNTLVYNGCTYTKVTTGPAGQCGWSVTSLNISPYVWSNRDSQSKYLKDGQYMCEGKPDINCGVNVCKYGRCSVSTVSEEFCYFLLSRYFGPSENTLITGHFYGFYRLEGSISTPQLGWWPLISHPVWFVIHGWYSLAHCGAKFRATEIPISLTLDWTLRVAVIMPTHLGQCFTAAT